MNDGANRCDHGSTNASRSFSDHYFGHQCPDPVLGVLRQTLARSHMNARPDPTQAPTPRLASDFQRLLFSVAIGAPATAAAEGLYLAISGNGLSTNVLALETYGLVKQRC